MNTAATEQDDNEASAITSTTVTTDDVTQNDELKNHIVERMRRKAATLILKSKLCMLLYKDKLGTKSSLFQPTKFTQVTKYMTKIDTSKKLAEYIIQ